jgi:hypothetical protein
MTFRRHARISFCLSGRFKCTVCPDIDLCSQCMRALIAARLKMAAEAGPLRPAKQQVRLLCQSFWHSATRSGEGPALSKQCTSGAWDTAQLPVWPSEYHHSTSQWEPVLQSASGGWPAAGSKPCSPLGVQTSQPALERAVGGPSPGRALPPPLPQVHQSGGRP